VPLKTVIYMTVLTWNNLQGQMA